MFDKILKTESREQSYIKITLYPCFIAEKSKVHGSSILVLWKLFSLVISVLGSKYTAKQLPKSLWFCDEGTYSFD